MAKPVLQAKELDKTQYVSHIVYMITCSRCKQDKLLSDFYVNNHKKLGRSSECKVCSKLTVKAYTVKNPEKIKKQKADYRKNNPAKLKEKYLKWKSKNPHYRRDYERKRRENDLGYRIVKNIRSRLWAAIKNKQTRGSVILNLGCSVEELISYLESQFSEGMTWANWGNGPGNWNIDHIYPLSKVNKEDAEAVKKAEHYTNLQPLWYEDNSSKSNKV